MNIFKIEMAEHADYFVFLMKQEFKNRAKWGLTRKEVDYLGKNEGLDCALVSMDKSEKETKSEIIRILNRWHFDKVRIRPMVSQELSKQFDSIERRAYDMGEWS